MDDLKAEFEKSSDYRRRLQILTLSPFSLERTAEFFDTTIYMVKKSIKIKEDEGILPQVGQVSRGKQVSAADRLKVIEFYESDTVSRMCPGAKDYVVVRDEEGSKTKVQKRLILGNLKEIYQLFKEDKTNPEIGFSTFAALRPRHCVLAGSSGTHNVCVCTYHQNVKLMVAALGIPGLAYRDLLDYAVCDVTKGECMMHSCTNCPRANGVFDFLNTVLDKSTQTGTSDFDGDDDEDFQSEVRFKKWISTDRCTLVDMVESREDFLESLSQKISQLSKHHYLAEEQSAYFINLRATVPPGEAVIVGDFSENYSFVVQEEVQSYHWDAAQCTIHPFVVYWRENDAERHQSFCFVSDETKHNASMVHEFLRRLIPEVQKLIPELRKIHYFSDGCAGQYKNKFNFINIAHHSRDFGIACEWHFFATSHGKSACDGIGGTVKRATATESLRRPHAGQILSTYAMFSFLTEKFETTIKFFLVQKEDVRKTSATLNARFSSAKTIAGTRQFHRFVPLDHMRLRVHELSRGPGKTVRIRR